MLRNSPTSYGSVTKFFHWILALLVIIQVLLIVWVNYLLPPKDPFGKMLIGKFHEPIGMLIVILAILAIIWRLINGRPNFPITMPDWEIYAARTVHALLYLCLIVMPLSGLIMAVTAGFPPNFFGLYQVPAFLEKSKPVSDLFFQIHATTAIILLVLVGIHTLAAFKHHFYDKDDVLRRML